jgi:hypothetical protein
MVLLALIVLDPLLIIIIIQIFDNVFVLAFSLSLTAKVEDERRNIIVQKMADLVRSKMIYQLGIKFHKKIFWDWKSFKQTLLGSSPGLFTSPLRFKLFCSFFLIK